MKQKFVFIAFLLVSKTLDCLNLRKGIGSVSIHVKVIVYCHLMIFVNVPLSIFKDD